MKSTYDFFHSSNIGLQDDGKVERMTGCPESVRFCGGHCSVSAGDFEFQGRANSVVKAFRMCENNITTGILICQSVAVETDTPDVPSSGWNALTQLWIACAVGVEHETPFCTCYLALRI